MRVLIVDDEPLARQRLRRLLDPWPEVTVVGEAADADEALARVREAAPECVLLDIELPGLDGMNLALGHALPPIIFVTAYPEHAVTAFEAEAVDYLVKPVRADRLRRALARARARLDARAPAERPAGFVPVTARRGAQVHVFDARRVLRFRAEQKYTSFLVDGREQLTDEPLGQLERRLAAHGYVRTHRAELVRLDAIASLHLEGRHAHVELADGQRAVVSRRQLLTLKRLLGLE
ncbi:MAG: response regulator transcription factor [Myxococcales bacterium]|nr:response regulator transcription factor [Myxococcales bacterium]